MLVQLVKINYFALIPLRIENHSKFKHYLIKKTLWLCTFIFLTPPWPVTSRSSKVVSTDKAQQNWCYSLIMHRLEDLDETLSEETKKSSGSRRDRKWLNFSFGYTWPGKGTKANRQNMSPPDRNRNPDKSPPTFLLMSPFLLTTLGHPSDHLFTHVHCNLPLGRIQHNTRRQCLPLCFVFSITRNGRFCLSKSYPTS